MTKTRTFPKKPAAPAPTPAEETFPLTASQAALVRAIEAFVQQEQARVNAAAQAQFAAILADHGLPSGTEARVVVEDGKMVLKATRPAPEA